jgi:hypothetical protein
VGVPVKIAQEQLGHASVQTTLNICTHVVDGSRRQAIEQLEASSGKMVSLNFTSWNPLDRWLQALDELRRAA